MKLIKIEKNYELFLKDTITSFLTPDKIYIPFDTSSLKIKSNDYIYKEHEICDFKNSPVSGEILGVKKMDLITEENVNVLVINNDFKEKQKTKKTVRNKTNELTQEDLLKNIKKISLQFAEKLEKQNDTIIINTIDKEPYEANLAYTSKYHFKEIFEIVDTITEILNIKNKILLLKENETDNIDLYNTYSGTYNDVVFKYIPDKYLITEDDYIKEFLNLTSNFVTIDVETLYDIYNLVKRKKIKTEKLITITGNAIKNPQVINCKLGTSLKEIIDEKIEKNSDDYEVIANGLLSGKKINEEKIIITSNIRSIFFMKQAEKNISKKCISCGMCNEVCPLNINIHKIIKDNKCLKNNCNKCGLCNYVCPSFIDIKSKVGDCND